MIPWLSSLNPSLVVDGGSNAGQWLCWARKLWPSAEYVCFEPQVEVVARIPADPLVRVELSALGSFTGELEFRESSFDQSSSVLKMGSLHKGLFPFSAGERVLRVPVTTLDSCFGDRVVDILKLDLQGYELEALKGGEGVLERCKALCIETSFVELYEGQPLFNEVCGWLFDRGWRYRGAVNAPLCGPDGMPLEEDSWFLR